MLRKASIVEILICRGWTFKHHFKENSDYDHDWGGVVLAEQCTKCGLVRHTCHAPDYNRYYYIDSEWRII